MEEDPKEPERNSAKPPGWETFPITAQWVAERRMFEADDPKYTHAPRIGDQREYRPGCR